MCKWSHISIKEFEINTSNFTAVCAPDKGIMRHSYKCYTDVRVYHQLRENRHWRLKSIQGWEGNIWIAKIMAIYCQTTLSMLRRCILSCNIVKRTTQTEMTSNHQASLTISVQRMMPSNTTLNTPEELSGISRKKQKNKKGEEGLANTTRLEAAISLDR